ncbi:DUF4393 domain-containing protein [Curtobacterium flaccumfaciens]|uniref:DUF4393 domain-containing protein n=1 Tax=Curtobacterium flaccumfaciens TaxID=2035 RepID=UPI0039956562
MTGMEAAAVTAAIGKGIAKAAAKDVAEQRSVNKALLDAVKETPEFKVATQRYGERMALRQGVATGLVRFFAKWLPVDRSYLDTGQATVSSDESVVEGIADDLARKLHDIPEEDLQPPKRSVAGPAFEGLGHVIDEPDLRELYLELLARAVDGKYAEAAHPSFVEVIRQLTSEEALLLRAYLSRMSGTGNFPIVTLQSTDQTGQSIERLYSHLLDFRSTNTGEPVRNESIPTYVDNWIRLGLVEVHYDAYLADPNSYEWVETRPETADARVAVSEREASSAPADREVETYMLNVVQGYMTPTSFGRTFALSVGMFGRLDREG